MTNEKKVCKIQAKLWDIFNEHGGYDYNDEMYWQLQGLQGSIDECMNDADWVNMLSEADTTLKYFKWIKSILVLKDNEPESLYC